MRAEQARMVAAQMVNKVARALMVGIAESYDKLGEIAEREERNEIG